jgi:hypothetical protein
MILAPYQSTRNLAATRDLINHLLKYLINDKRTQILNVKKTDHEIKWKNYTCVGRNTKYITKLSENSKLKISYSTDGTLDKLLNCKCGIKTNRSTSVVSYQLTCPDSYIKYIGQTGISTRFKEHFRDFKYANAKSKFAQNVLEYGPLFHRSYWGYHGNPSCCKQEWTAEHNGKFYIQNIRRLDNHVNDKCTTKPNILFDVIVLNSTDRGHQYTRPPYKPNMQVA